MSGNGRQSTNGRTSNVAAGVSDLAYNVIELSELQAQLAMLDAKKSVAKARSCLIMAVVGVAMLLGTIPVALLAIAALFVEQLEWSYAASAGIATAIGLVITAIVMGIAYGYVRSGLIDFDRSRDELRRNIAWVKHTLRTRGHAETREEYPVNF